MATIPTGEQLAAKVTSKVRAVPIPYKLGGRSDKGTDCINLAGWCCEELGCKKTDVPYGSNTAWRTAMQWKGTMKEAVAQGKLVPGALIYIKRAATEQWPDGDYGHVGVYTGWRQGFPQNHIQVHASSAYGVVSIPTETRWNCVAWLKCIDYSQPAATPDKPEESGATPTTPTEPTTPAVDSTIPKVPYKATVKTSGGILNLRKQPNTLSDNRIAKMPNGSSVEVIEVVGSWRRVKFEKQTGYCQTAYLNP